MNLLRDYASLKDEEGAIGVQEILDQAYETLQESVAKLEALEINQEMLENEPSDLESIRALRPNGPRRLWYSLEEEVYYNKLKGAFLSRLAGCTLGAPVEFWSVSDMENWASYIGDTFPPTDYWSMIKNPGELRYTKGDFVEYTRQGLNKVPVDDDIAYTLMSLLVVENYGLNFSVEQVGEMWSKLLPMAYTAEEIAIENIKKQVQIDKVAEKNNPYFQWIGADIRADGFAYMAPGYPEKAAELAYKDAYLSHRRNGIYGEMFLAAAQSAAFAVENPIEALKIGLTEIPQGCLLAREVRWALEIGPSVKNYKEARRLVDERFDGMSHAHTINNMMLMIFGLYIGKNNMTKVISETVAMGMDNDCTTASGASIVGAVVGFEGVEKHWYEPFNNVIDVYFKGCQPMEIEDVIQRFMSVAKELYEGK